MYSKGFYDRFKAYSEDFKLDLKCLKAPKIRNQTLFIGSGTDIFGNWILDETINQILQELRKIHKSNTIIFLTKNPQRYLNFEFSENMICGVTIETDYDLPEYYSEAPKPIDRLKFLIQDSDKIKCESILISIEPVIRFSSGFCLDLFKIPKLKFIILGFNTSKLRMDFPTPSQINNFETDFISLKNRFKRNIELIIKPNMRNWFKTIIPNCYPIKLR